MTRSRNSARRSCGASPTGWGRRQDVRPARRAFAVMATGGHLLRDLPGHAERPDPHAGAVRRGRHDYRRETPEAVRQVFGLQASDEQMQRVQKSLRERELRFESSGTGMPHNRPRGQKRAGPRRGREAHLRLDRARGGRRRSRSLRSRREPRAGSVQHPAWPSLRRRSVRAWSRCDAARSATVSAAMMSPDAPPRRDQRHTTQAVEAEDQRQPQPAFRTPTSNVIAFCCGTGSERAGDAVAGPKGQSSWIATAIAAHADPGHEQRAQLPSSETRIRPPRRGEGDRTNDLRALGANRKKCPTVMPTAGSTPMTSNTSLSMSIAFRSIDRMISEQSGATRPTVRSSTASGKSPGGCRPRSSTHRQSDVPRTGASRCWTRCPAGGRPPGSFPAPPIPARRDQREAERDERKRDELRSDGDRDGQGRRMACRKSSMVVPSAMPNMIVAMTTRKITMEFSLNDPDGVDVPGRRQNVHELGHAAPLSVAIARKQSFNVGPGASRLTVQESLAVRPTSTRSRPCATRRATHRRRPAA